MPVQVETALGDEAISVREAAVELLGKHISHKCVLIVFYLILSCQLGIAVFYLDLDYMLCIPHNYVSPVLLVYTSVHTKR